MNNEKDGMHGSILFIVLAERFRFGMIVGGWSFTWFHLLNFWMKHAKRGHFGEAELC
jgi:hypothetical protein